LSKAKDLYAVLGVLPDAQPEVIRAVYLALAKKYHPDSSRSTENVEKFKELNAAYEILRNPDKRKEYDAARPDTKDSMGDYEPDVDDEDVTVDDDRDEWECAVDYHPEVAGLLREVAAVSPTLSIVFQSTILNNQAFPDAHNVKEILISNFLCRYFGKSTDIQEFAKKLLHEKKLAAANELNRAAKIFGDNIHPQKTMRKITEKYNLSISFEDWSHYKW